MSIFLFFISTFPGFFDGCRVAIRKAYLSCSPLPPELRHGQPIKSENPRDLKFLNSNILNNSGLFGLKKICIKALLTIIFYQTVISSPLVNTARSTIILRCLSVRLLTRTLFIGTPGRWSGLPAGSPSTSVLSCAPSVMTLLGMKTESSLRMFSSPGLLDPMIIT